MERKIGIVDLETTGFSPRKSFIVEVGIVELNLDTGETKKLYDAIVKEDGFEEKHRDSWVFQNTDLTFEDVMKAEPLNKAEIQAIFSEYEMTAYNNAFDFGFLEDRGIRINKLPCPMKLSTNVCRIKNSRGFGYKWPKAQEAWDHFFGKDTGYVEKHRGYDDALHEAKIVHELHKIGVFK